ncbi:MAG: hypothetical protein CL535_23850 [Ahrensia sp.]|nr:hypothetical protein [Ahrensia sp.]
MQQLPQQINQIGNAKPLLSLALHAIICQLVGASAIEASDVMCWLWRGRRGFAPAGEQALIEW